MNISKILRIVQNNLDQEALQCYSMSPEQMFELYKQTLMNDSAIVVEHGGYVIWGNLESTYVLRIHIFSDQKNFGVVNSLRILTTQLFEKYPFIKIYGVTPNKGFVRMSQRAGWKPDGKLSKSFITGKGDIIDQYVLSAYREDYVDKEVQPIY